MRPVVVQFDKQPVISIADPPPVSYPQTTDITDPALIKGNKPGITYSYWKDEAATISVANPKTLVSGGRYYIKAVTTFGCSVILPVEVRIYIGQPPIYFHQMVMASMMYGRFLPWFLTRNVLWMFITVAGGCFFIR
jgi:hypothetical protein